MKTIRTLAVLAALAALEQYAFGEYYVRPFAGYMHYQNTKGSTHGNEVVGISIGKLLGQDDAHELGFELSTSYWKYQFGSYWNDYLLGVKGSGHFTPILVSYRFYAGRQGSRFRFYAGPSAGVSYLNAGFVSSWSGWRPGSGGVNTWLLTYSGTAGVQYSLTPSMALGIGYRYAEASATEAHLANGRAVDRWGIGPTKTHTIRMEFSLRL